MTQSAGWDHQTKYEVRWLQPSGEDCKFCGDSSTIMLVRVSKKSVVLLLLPLVGEPSVLTRASGKGRNFNPEVLGILSPLVNITITFFMHVCWSFLSLSICFCFLAVAFEEENISRYFRCRGTLSLGVWRIQYLMCALYSSWPIFLKFSKSYACSDVAAMFDRKLCRPR